MKNSWLLMVLTILLSACASPSSAPTQKPTAAQAAIENWSLPETQVGCEKAGGEWINMGMPGDPNSAPSCKLDAPDAGKSCSSGDQCLSGACVPKNQLFNYNEITPGVCADRQRVNGCMLIIDEGLVTSQPCAM